MFVTDINTRKNIFNNSLAGQCTPLKKDNILATKKIFFAESRVCFLDFIEDEINKIIRDLNIHKVHVHDDISIRMIKNCGKPLLKAILPLFYNSVTLSYYPDIRKTSYLFMKRVAKS